MCACNALQNRHHAGQRLRLDGQDVQMLLCVLVLADIIAVLASDRNTSYTCTSNLSTCSYSSSDACVVMRVHWTMSSNWCFECSAFKDLQLRRKFHHNQLFGPEVAFDMRQFFAHKGSLLTGPACCHHVQSRLFAFD